MRIQPQPFRVVGYEEILFEALDRYDEALLGQRRFPGKDDFFGGFCGMNMQQSGKHTHIYIYMHIYIQYVCEIFIGP